METACERKVYIGTTALFNVDPFWMQSLLKAEAHFLKAKYTGKSKISARLGFYAGESPLGRSRNSLTAEFLKSDCTDLLFIDSDLIFSAEQIERIVMHEEDVVGGVYFIKSEGHPRPCWNHKIGNETPREDGLMEVRYIGTGFLRIRRSVFERMIESFGKEIWYDTDNAMLPKEKQYDFWKMGVYEYSDGDRRWLSEDWWFCQKCIDIGIPVYADCKLVIKHSGNAIYPLSYQHDILFPRPAPEIEKENMEEVAEYDLEMSEAPKTILDIGANVGAFAITAHAKWPEAKIACYEPIRRNYKNLIEHVRDIPQVSTYQLAVRDFNGSGEMLIGNTWLGCSFHELGAQSEKTEQVMCIKAEQIPSAELVKIDTEGCELEILNHLDLSETKAVLLEYHRKDEVTQMQVLMGAFGFERSKLKPLTEQTGILKFIKSSPAPAVESAGASRMTSPLVEASAQVNRMEVAR